MEKFEFFKKVLILNFWLLLASEEEDKPHIREHIRYLLEEAVNIKPQSNEVWRFRRQCQILIEGEVYDE